MYSCTLRTKKAGTYKLYSKLFLKTNVTSYDWLVAPGPPHIRHSRAWLKKNNDHIKNGFVAGVDRVTFVIRPRDKYRN
jgi:hypothetical protein